MIVDISKKILIVGLGLLGGSYARVLKRFGFPVSAITLEQEVKDLGVYSPSSFFALQDRIFSPSPGERSSASGNRIFVNLQEKSRKFSSSVRPGKIFVFSRNFPVDLYRKRC